MDIFRTSQNFPKAETYSLTDQIRRSSRSVTANLAEAWEKRRYEAAFIAKLADSCAEAAETQNWILYAHASGYIEHEEQKRLLDACSGVLRTLHAMISHADRWCRPSN